MVLFSDVSSVIDDAVDVVVLPSCVVSYGSFNPTRRFQFLLWISQLSVRVDRDEESFHLVIYGLGVVQVLLDERSQANMKIFRVLIFLCYYF